MDTTNIIKSIGICGDCREYIHSGDSIAMTVFVLYWGHNR